MDMPALGVWILATLIGLGIVIAIIMFFFFGSGSTRVLDVILGFFRGFGGG